MWPEAELGRRAPCSPLHALAGNVEAATGQGWPEISAANRARAAHDDANVAGVLEYLRGGSSRGGTPATAGSRLCGRERSARGTSCREADLAGGDYVRPSCTVSSAPVTMSASGAVDELMSAVSEVVPPALSSSSWLPRRAS